MNGLSTLFILLTLAEVLTGGTTRDALHLMVVAMFAEIVRSYLGLLRNQRKLAEKLKEVSSQ